MGCAKRFEGLGQARDGSLLMLVDGWPFGFSAMKGPFRARKPSRTRITRGLYNVVRAIDRARQDPAFRGYVIAA